MDNLKALLEQKKQNLAGQKWVKVGDLEKERHEQYLKEKEAKEKKQEEKLKRQLEETIQYVNTYKKVHTENHSKNLLDPVRTSSTNSTKDSTQQENNSESHGSNTITDFNNINKPTPVPKTEIIKRLRALGLPITLFGENDWARYMRLIKSDQEKLDDEIKKEGNTFHKDLKLNEDEFKNQKELKEFFDDVDEKKLEERLEQSRKQLDLSSLDCKGRKKMNLADGVSLDQRCEDVYYWCKKVLKEWDNHLKSQPEEYQNSPEGKREIGIYRQCKRYIKPLFEVLKNRTLSNEILDALFNIAHLCLLKEYIKAYDKYLEIAIGNAPWPMGVTMVGIHERSGRSKIFSSQVAHILNDETQRKYLQSIKRLITLAQKFNPPADATQMIRM